MNFLEGRWHRVKRSDPRVVTVGERSSSRQTIGAAEFMSSGRTLVLLTDDTRAVWGAIENLDPAGAPRWRVSIFRNEGAGLSSTLIVEATARTYEFWRRKYRGLPAVPLQTEVDPAKTRKKRDAGRCFRRAGWFEIDRRRGLVVLQAPGEGSA